MRGQRLFWSILQSAFDRLPYLQVCQCLWHTMAVPQLPPSIRSRRLMSKLYCSMAHRTDVFIQKWATGKKYYYMTFGSITHTHAYIYIYTHTYIHTYRHTYIHTDIHTYIPTYIHTYRHTYIHTDIHTYIHTYTYIQSQLGN